MEYSIIEHKGNKFLHLKELEDIGLKNSMTTGDMDVGLKTNKDIESIRSNLNKTYEFMGIDPKVLFNGYQTHSGNISLIKSHDDGLEGPFGRYFPNTDGLITDMKDVALITRFADCVPIILFDTKKKVQGNIHSGWKGTLQMIGKRGVEALVKEYHCDIKDLIAIIGPSIGKNDFEVEEDVSRQFRDVFPMWTDLIVKKNEKKYLIDLQEIVYRMLLEEGIGEEKITKIDISTYSDHRFHSYRRDKENYSLMGFVTMIK